MFAEFKFDQGVNIAVLPETFDDTQGKEFVSRMEGQVPRGGKFIVDGTHLKTLTQKGVLHLMAAQRWTSTLERKRLPLVGFDLSVWRAIVENGCDFIFESKPTLPEALQYLAASASSVPAVPAAPSTAPSTPPRSSPKAEVWPRPFPVDPPAAPAAPPKPVAAPIQPSVFSKPAPKPPAKGSWKKWRWAVAAVLLALLAAGWWWAASRPPELVLSAAATVVEEDGKEPDAVTVQVRRGRLVERSADGLPKGLYLEPPSGTSGDRTYILRGKAEPGASTATVGLVAYNDKDERSAPVAFTVTVKKKPMTWQTDLLRTLHLRVGKEIWTGAKFLVNADGASAKTALPPGLTIELVPGRNKDWQLAGTPTAAGNFPVVFVATTPTGQQEEQACTLEVAANTPPAPSPSPAAPPLPSPDHGGNSDKTTPAPAPVVVEDDLDNGMRQFLLERVEQLPARYTKDERIQLREVVGVLRRARRVCTVMFERDGQTDVSPEQTANLKAALAAPGNARLLENPACQIVIIGFASKTGSPASNVRISQQRAYNVNTLFKGSIGHNADLCGDYGPTDVVDPKDPRNNRAVEVYAGLMELTPLMKANAEMFKRQFNQNHGLR